MVNRRPRTGVQAQQRAPVLWLFGLDWAALAARRFAATHRVYSAGFDLFSFPSNARVLWFDIHRFVERIAKRHHRNELQAVLSHEEQFGALAAALLAEKLGLPGTDPKAILRLQHKEICREIIERVCPENNMRFEVLNCELGQRPDQNLTYPIFVKPIKASFSVLARKIDSYDELCQHLSFRPIERHIISRLVSPFDDVCQQLLSPATNARRMLIEEPVQAEQFNLDGYVRNGKAHLIGVVDEVMYPGTQAFMRFEYPSKLGTSIQQRAFDVAGRVLAEAGFTHGFFNMEFFYDKVSDKLQIVEFNPRLAAQLADLYERVDGVDVHAMSLALALGQDPATVPTKEPRGAIAASCALRTFDGTMPANTSWAKRRSIQANHPDSIVLYFNKSKTGTRREFKWMNSNRYGVINLHGTDLSDLNNNYQAICDSLNWPAPF